MEHQQQMTEFNSNLATLIRVDNFLKVCADCCFNDNFNGWFKGLNLLKREVIVKLRGEPEVKTECLKMFMEMERKLSIYYKSKGRKDSFLNTTIDNELDKIEIFLREIMDRKGMLLRDAEVGIAKFRNG